MDRSHRTRLKLRDLHILLAVVQQGSMAKAAADLAISQPAVSKAIADMEHTVACVCSIARGKASSRRCMAAHSSSAESPFSTN